MNGHLAVCDADQPASFRSMDEERQRSGLVFITDEKTVANLPYGRISQRCHFKVASLAILYQLRRQTVTRTFQM